MSFVELSQIKIVSSLHCSPDHSVRSRQHIWRDRQADLLGGFEIDDELKLLRLLDGKVSGLGAFEDLVHVSCRAPVQVRGIRPVVHEAAVIHPCCVRVYGRDSGLFE